VDAMNTAINTSNNNYIVYYVGLQNTSLNNTINAMNTSNNNYIIANNASVNNWVNSAFATIASLNNYVSWVGIWGQVYNETEVNAINTSMMNYVDFQNTSQTNAMTAQNLSQRYHIDTKLNLSGGTMTGNLNLSANVNLTMNGGNQIGSNVTCVIIKGSTSTLRVC
jgi:hypothetical protein